MADPITWRSIGTPDFRGSAASMAAAANTIDGAFSGLRGALKDYRTEEEKFAAKRTKDNTAAYLTHLASFQDPASAEAALKSGQLTEMLRGYGSEIDAPTAIAAQNSLVQNLQQRAVQAMQFQQEGQKFKDYQTDIGQRDTVNALQEALQRASTPDEVNRIKQALGIYQNQGYVDGRAGVDIIKNAVARESGLVTEGRAAEKHNREGIKLDADLAHQKEQEHIARGQLGVSQQNANINAVQAAANLALNLGGKAATIAGDYSKEVAKIQERAQEFEKNSPFGGGQYAKTDISDFLKLGKTAGAKDQAVNDFLGKLKEEFPSGSIKKAGEKDAVPITKRMVEEAIVRGAEQFAWRPGWTADVQGDNMLNVLKQMVNSPALNESYADYLRKQSEYAQNIKAIKESGKAASDKIVNDVAPYLDALGARVGGGSPKR